MRDGIVKAKKSIALRLNGVSHNARLRSDKRYFHWTEVNLLQDFLDVLVWTPKLFDMVKERRLEGTSLPLRFSDAVRL
jgi:hypothetical protein